MDIIGLILGISWFVIAALSIVFSVIFFKKSKTDELPRARYTSLGNAVFFLIGGFTKIFDLLFVNLGGELEPIPLFPVFSSEVLHYLALVEMTLYLAGFTVLIFLLEKYFVKTYYILTSVPIIAIFIAWIFNADLFVPNILDLANIGQDQVLFLTFYLSRLVLPLLYLYIGIKSTGTIRKKSLALFFAYFVIATAYIRHPLFWLYITPFGMLICFYLIYYGFFKE